MTQLNQSPATLKHKLRIAIFASLVFITGVMSKGCNGHDETPLFIYQSK